MEITRSLLLSQLKSDHHAADLYDELERCRDSWLTGLGAKGFTYIAVFYQDSYIFTYVEHLVDAGDFGWPQACLSALHQWPGDTEQKSHIRLIDVFHDGMPVDHQSWRTKRSVESAYASLQRLKPDMVSSYIFYHYQLQEERPGSFNQTYIIGACQNLLVSYHEVPEVRSSVKRVGKLRTNQTPEHWHELMQTHFLLDTASAKPWKPMTLFFRSDIQTVIRNH